MTAVIQTENLGKKYMIQHGAGREKYTALRDVIASRSRSLIRRMAAPFNHTNQENPNRPATREEFWALKQICLEIKVGDRVGIIGRNGAGKSTLLKLLSRITTPSEGQIKIKGRIASLLEAGTGFHQELTGKENIFLNGAVLGMTRSEIKSKFDEIVAFAEVEKFLDTPVKRYSSGMYVRLAFAVAAHLEPEILLVDEVLAVGDVNFQKKCLGKMKNVEKSGRTVLFVSHNMGAIEQLCNSAMLLENGHIKTVSADVKGVISSYLKSDEDCLNTAEWSNIEGMEHKNDYFTPLKLYLTDDTGITAKLPHRNDSDLWLNIIGETKKLDPHLHISYGVYTHDGIYLYGSARTDFFHEKWPEIKIGKNLFKAKIPKHFLNEGLYRVELYIGLRNSEQWFAMPGRKCPSIQLEIAGGLSPSPYWTEKRPGMLAPVLEWTT